MFSLVNKIEQDADMLREKTKTLTDLLYGQAGTENAIKSYDLSRNLTVFTWLTVFFTPLSFVTALFALQIESFTPPEGTWTVNQVVQGSAWCVFATFSVSVMYILIQKTSSRSMQSVSQYLGRIPTGISNVATSK